MKHQFVLNNIQVRSVDGSGPRKIYIKGKAVVADVPHIYKHYTDKTGKVLKSFKSLFTKNAVESIRSQMMHKRVFADAMHEIAANINGEHIIDSLKNKYPDLSDDLEQLRANFKMKELPLLKPIGFNVEDDGLWMEIESNPHFAQVDDSHAKVYEAVTGSILNGFLNGLSINFKPTDVVEEEGIEKINDVDFYGISIVPDAAMGSHTGIMEVAVRSIMEIRGGTEMTENEQTPAPKEQPKQTPVADPAPVKPTPQPQVDPALIQRAVEEALAKRQQQMEVEQQKVEYERMKQELADLKSKQTQQSQSGSQGLAKVDVDKSQLNNVDWWKTRLEDMTFKELVLLNEEFKQKVPTMIRETAYRGKHVGGVPDPRATPVYHQLDGNQQSFRDALLAAREADTMNFKEINKYR